MIGSLEMMVPLCELNCFLTVIRRFFATDTYLLKTQRALIRTNINNDTYNNLYSTFMIHNYSLVNFSSKILIKRKSLSCECEYFLRSVLQGSTLRPLRFLVYINDLSDNVPTLLFADNSSLFARVHGVRATPQINTPHTYL